MSEGFELSKAETEEGFDPMYFMRTLAEKVLVEHGGDEKKARSLVADVLHFKGVDGILLHHLSPERQQKELLGILEDPTDKEEIGALFDWEAIPDELKEHYELS